jgi:hypothetical protein
MAWSCWSAWAANDIKATFDYILVKPVDPSRNPDGAIIGGSGSGDGATEACTCFVERVLLPPADALVLSSGCLLPNSAFPSDHIPLVADIRIAFSS